MRKREARKIALELAMSMIEGAMQRGAAYEYADNHDLPDNVIPKIQDALQDVIDDLSVMREKFKD